MALIRRLSVAPSRTAGSCPLTPAFNELVQSAPSESNRTGNWFAHILVGARAMASAARATSIPAISAVFDVAVLILESAERARRNRETLRDLCSSVFEIISMLREENENGCLTSGPMVDFCGDLLEILEGLHASLRNVSRKKKGLLGRFLDIFGAHNMAEELQRHQHRLNELRANFVLISAVRLNLAVNSLAVSAQPALGQFRDVPLGDIDLLYKSTLASNTHGIKLFTARIAGISGAMTVVQYTDKTWAEHLALCSHLRDPGVLQLFGITKTPMWTALIFHDEMVPLEAYREVHRPDSDIDWVLVEGMLFSQFKEAAEYHIWTTEHDGQPTTHEASIWVKLNPPRLCLAFPRLHTDELRMNCSNWHAPNYKFLARPIRQSQLQLGIPTPTRARTTERDLTAALVPTAIMQRVTPSEHHKFTLGAGFQLMYGEPWTMNLIPELAQICDAFTKVDWMMSPFRPSSICVAPIFCEMSNRWIRLTFQPGGFAHEMNNPLGLWLIGGFRVPYDRQPHYDIQWLSGTCTKSWISGPSAEEMLESTAWGVTLGLTCHVGVTPPEGKEWPTLSKSVYLFLCPLDLDKEGTLTLPANRLAYWSLDALGETELSPGALNLPEIEVRLIVEGNIWHQYHFRALQEWLASNIT
ncbi:hypothetical protein MKEN_00199700 [Mycena kentingensis (nom. inval.)]|nr:hypothetical protein MKEN_00199700 [Mycena kentingensis (nom. inval.)]